VWEFPISFLVISWRIQNKKNVSQRECQIFIHKLKILIAAKGIKGWVYIPFFFMNSGFGLMNGRECLNFKQKIRKD
jgi:hypothetical protein